MNRRIWQTARGSWNSCNGKLVY